MILSISSGPPIILTRDFKEYKPLLFLLESAQVQNVVKIRNFNVKTIYFMVRNVDSSIFVMKMIFFAGQMWVPSLKSNLQTGTSRLKRSRV